MFYSFPQSKIGRLCVILSILSLFCASSEAVISVGKNAARELLHMDNVSDLSVTTIFVFVAYCFQYLGLGGVFEVTNPHGFRSTSLPQKETQRRYRQVRTEAMLGVKSMLVTVALTMLWMFYGEKYTPFYGYFETHEYNWRWCIGSLVAYIFWFDTWFYWSHRWLHDIDWLWHNVHYVHHQFKEPSAFAQFAVHPVEAALQGPVGHYCVTFFFPVHPVALAVWGFLSSAWAVAAHDGRWGDFNSHYYHHSKGRGRRHYFNLGFVTPFWDMLCGTRWSEDHPKWVEWNKNKNKTIFDTRDGTAKAIRNDKFEVYSGIFNKLE